jgi:hypothetical protein
MFYRVVTFSLVFLVSCLLHVYAETYAGNFRVFGQQTWAEEECYWDVTLDFTAKVTLPPGDGDGEASFTYFSTYVGSNSPCETWINSNNEIVGMELTSSGSDVDGSIGDPHFEKWTWSATRTENSLDGFLMIQYGNGDILFGLFNHALALFSDDFEDGDVSDWTTRKGSWERWEVIFGRLVGSSDGKTDIISPFPGGSIYTVETPVILRSKGVKASVLAWYNDKKNYVELQVTEDKIILKQKVDGQTLIKSKSKISLNPFESLWFRVLYNEATGCFEVYLNAALVLVSEPTTQPPFGTVGFRVQKGTAIFGEALVY